MGAGSSGEGPLTCQQSGQGRGGCMAQCFQEEQRVQSLCKVCEASAEMSREAGELDQVSREEVVGERSGR